MTRYHHKVINTAYPNALEAALETDANYELVRIVPYSIHQTVLVFIEHTVETDA